MTEIQSDEERRKPVMLYEIHGISREDCSAILEQHIDNTLKLDRAENKIRMACDILKLLTASDERIDDEVFSCRTLEQFDRVQSLLKSAAKNIEKYYEEQKIRVIEDWKQGRKPGNGGEPEQHSTGPEDLIARAERYGFTVHQALGEQNGFEYQLIGPKMTLEGIAEMVTELDKGGAA